MKFRVGDDSPGSSAASPPAGRLQLVGSRARPTPGRNATARPVMDPRMLARRVAVVRARRRRRRRVVVGVMTAVTALVGAWLLAHSPALAVQRIDVEGGRHTGRDAVLAVAGVARGRPMLDADPAAIRRRVLAMPWVSAASVWRTWPGTISIRIRERVPVAWADVGAGQVAVVDGQGRVLSWEAAPATGSVSGPVLPRLAGVGVVGAAGTSLGAPSAGPLAAVGALEKALAPGRQLASVSRDDGGLRAEVVPGPVTVVLGTADDLPAKAGDTAYLLGRIPAGSAAQVDVRVVDAPVLTIGPNSGIVSTTQRG